MPDFHFFALLFIGLYISSLLLVGYLSKRKTQSVSLQDFYLANSNLGLLVLIFTLFATQYSGNNLVGFTGASYKLGFSWLISVPFMASVVVGYLLFAPKLHRLSHENKFVTPTDFLNFRYQSPALNLLASILMTVVLGSYIVAQLMAIGRTVQGYLGPDIEAYYIYGIIGLSLIIVVYEWMGGMRAVVWTDLIQGLVMLMAFLMLLFIVFSEFGSLSQATQTLLSTDQSAKVAPPTLKMNLTWLNYLLLVSLGASLYPQAIQRIYAARSGRVLRRSFSIMVFLPFVTTLVVVILGVMAAAYLPGIKNQDQVLATIMKVSMSHSMLGYMTTVILFSGLLAAIMSTVDSALLTISSIIAKDFVGGSSAKKKDSQDLTRVGKRASVVMMAVFVMLAIAMRENSLIDMINLKLDLLVQLVPAFMIGIHWSKLKPKPVFWGMLLGCLLTCLLIYTGHKNIMGLSAGLFGLVLNISVAVLGSIRIKRMISL